MYELPSDWIGDIGITRDFVDSDQRYTTFHGLHMFYILHYMAVDARYNLYRVTSENGTMKPSNTIEALDKARNECDIISMSIGQVEVNCDLPFSLCKSAQSVVESGTIIVAAAGNRNRSSHISCPAGVEEVVSVGSSVAECRADMDNAPGDDSDLFNPSSDSIRPPNSYWIEKRGDEDEEYWRKLFGDDFPEGPFCSHMGCSPFHQCEENSYEREWEGNVEEVPDTLAPHHYIGEVVGPNNDVFYSLRRGSSFATPVVAGCLAGILGKLFEEGKKPEPETVKQAVREMGDELDSGDGLRFNARRTYEYMSKKL